MGYTKAIQSVSLACPQETVPRKRKLGIIAILHTWTQTLTDHFHLHCLVPGGALSEDGRKWLDCSDKFLFPVKALSKVFRG
ncbi:MAG: transposase [Syntrophaceae bacterium]|nr:transposase [Syntrophaceae bacterium]